MTVKFRKCSVRIDKSLTKSVVHHVLETFWYLVLSTIAV